MATALQAALQLAEKTGYLHLSYMGLTSVPEAVFNVKGLIRLDLSHNELTHLPSAVGQLPSLEELFLNDNPLASIPPSIERCVSLRVVDLRDTDLSGLPKELSNLQTITHLDLTGCHRMPAAVLAAYAKGGTTGLLGFLAEQEARRDLTTALLQRLAVDVYTEASDTASGQAAIARLVDDIGAEFTDNDQLRTVIRNAERLCPLDLHTATASGVRERYDALSKDNARKALAADIELAIRAIYYGRTGPRQVEGMVHGIMACMASLEDAQFLVKHAKALFPPAPEDVSGPRLLADLQALRQRMIDDMRAAQETLLRALGGVYPDREPSEVQKLCSGMCALLKPDDIRSLAADAADLFPPEFASARPRKIVKAFAALKLEKGL